MNEKIAKMSLAEVQVYYKDIGNTTLKRDVKTKLYEACEKRMKELDLSNAVVVRSQVDE